MDHNGLTSSQVEECIRQGKVNQTTQQSKHTTARIILKNTLTIFNLVNLVLALMIIAVGSYKNLLFILIAVANTLISIINEIRAKRTIDKLKLISEQNPTVVRDGKTIQIAPEELVEGDLMILSLGNQIIVDAKISEGGIEVNESYVTGEQDNIAKSVGDKLISASFVVAGTCKAIVTKVGADSSLAKLEQSAHTIKTEGSKLFTLMNNIVKYISLALIPIGALFLWSRFRADNTTTEVAITSTVAALINMIPEGLILLTSSVLALATIRLSRKKVLVQDMYSIETLARVDTICLDKTGTLTTGNMTVHDFILPDGKTLTKPSKAPTPTEKSFLTVLESILSHQTSENATINALKQKLAKKTSKCEIEDVTEVISFSSERKCSGIKTKDATYLLGAVEFVTGDEAIINHVKKASGGYRTLAIVKKTPESILSSGCSLLGFIRLEDEIRHDAPDIINYFYNNDIAVKIISGDDLDSVTTIATKVGVRDLKGINLSDEKKANYTKLVKEYNVFTRVTPSQKKELIKAFKKQGSTVAMTGDGVNDILAMKEADVSLAIGEGADAARRSAKMVLLDSDFGGVPSIIDEGRQSINNLERSTTLFLSKTVYASILAVIFSVISIEYPYAPIEMSLLNFACIGLPGLILALEHNTARIKNQFISNIVNYSVPVGITVSIAMTALAITADINGFARPELLTASFFITFAVDIAMIYQISRPLNPLRTILIASIAIIVIGAYLIPFTRNLLDLGFLSPNALVITISLVCLSLLLFLLLRHLPKPKSFTKH
ncbi:HAD-IC family P-type ATPase [Candidatus Saccharibacteria bacterium]|nr:HAD-IC family P-type ATPase [Candidatus Saccharibacteria bacterium]